LIKSQ